MRNLRFFVIFSVFMILFTGSAFGAAPAAVDQASRDKTLQEATAALKSNDLAKAKKVLKPLVDKNESVSQFLMGMISIQESGGNAAKLKTAETWLKKSAATGYPGASLQLGNLYASGKLGSPDYKKARAEWQKVISSKINDPEYDRYMRSIALVNMGSLQMEGLGGTAEPEKAVQSFKKAAEYGNPQGMFFMGQAYKLGSGVKQDNKQAKDWFTKAKDAGLPQAQQAIDSLN